MATESIQSGQQESDWEEERKVEQNREFRKRYTHMLVLIHNNVAIANTWGKDALFNKKNWINLISE